VTPIKRAPFDERRLLSAFESNPTKALSISEIAEAAEFPEEDHRKLHRLLKRLVNAGWLSRLKGKRYQLRKLRPPTAPKSEKSSLGLFRKVGDSVFVEPLQTDDEDRGSGLILIDQEQDVAHIDDLCIVQYEISKEASRSKSAFAKIIRTLGKRGEREAGIMKRLLDSELPLEFPSAVLEQADALPDAVQKSDHKSRRDLRDLPLVTIDGSDAKDFDDAVCVQKSDTGFILYVAIADVSYYVRPDSPLDQEAYRRGTSIYLSDRCIPMLPEKLSNGLCSLRPQVERLCFVAEMHMDKSGIIGRSEFYRAVMRSHARLTYEQVAQALEGEPDEICQGLLPDLKRLQKVARALLKRRMARGSIDLDIPEPFIVFDEETQPIDSVRRARNDAHRLIEDLMLAANEAVALQMSQVGRPSIFRVHEDPDREKLEAFLDLTSQLGLGLKVKLKQQPKPKDLSRMIEQLVKLKAPPTLQMLILRSMAQARYTASNLGHFGLSAENYLHFTSPIRRYPDLLAHRLLNDFLESSKPGYSKEQIEEIAEKCSQRERSAITVERGCLDYDRCIIASKHIGETFDGIITTVKEFGMFVAIQEPFVEGLVPISSMSFDYFELDELGATLIGEHTGKSYMLSQKIEVEIVAANLEQGKVEFRLIEKDFPEGTTNVRHRGRRGRGRPRKEDSDRPKPRGRKKSGRKKQEGRSGSSTPRKRGGKKANPRKRKSVSRSKRRT
jgi:ribonuclease R